MATGNKEFRFEPSAVQESSGQRAHKGLYCIIQILSACLEIPTVVRQKEQIFRHPDGKYRELARTRLQTCSG